MHPNWDQEAGKCEENSLADTNSRASEETRWRRGKKSYMKSISERVKTSRKE